MRRLTPFSKGFSKKKNKCIAILIGILSLFLAFLLVIPSFNTPEEPYLKYKELVSELSDKYSLSCSLVFSIIECESYFDEKAVSIAGAVGLMQLMPETFDWIMSGRSEKGDILNPRDNIEAGCKYLSYLFRRFGVTETVLAAYNAGEGTVSAWLKNSEYSDNGTVLKQIPFQETRLYVSKVLRRSEYYKKSLK